MPTWKALFERVPLHEASFDFVLRLSAFKENAFVCDGRRENDFRWFLLLPRQVANAAPLGGLLPTWAIRIQRIYFGAEYAREYAYSLRPSTQ